MEQTKRVIVGLGNPGSEFAGTRHNAGFDALDLFAKLNSIKWDRVSKGAQTATGRVRDADLILVKPLTYMNLSGEPLARILRNTEIAPADVMVVVDDIHLPIGRIRIRQGGSDGGHNGLKSITANLKTQEYPRLRIGVGEPGATDKQIDHVLGRFSRAEQEQMQEVIERVVAALETWISDGTEDGYEPVQRRLK